MNSDNISEKSIESFKKISSESSLKAAKSLSKLTKEETVINISHSFIAKPELLYSQFGDAEKKVVTVALNINGSLNGYAMLIWSEEEARRLVRHLNKFEEGDGEFSELDLSALKEVGNILSAALVDVLSETMGSSSLHSLPAIEIDMLKATLDEICAQIAISSNDALVFAAEVDIKPLSSSLYLVILLDVNSTEKLLKKLS